jgi:hypothetical protein
MALPCLGAALQVASLLVVDATRLDLGWLIAGFAFTGCLGSFVLAVSQFFTYMADISTSGERRSAFHLMEGCLLVAGLVANLSSGPLIDAGGDTVFWTLLAVNTVLTVLILAFLPSSSSSAAAAAPPPVLSPPSRLNVSVDGGANDSPPAHLPDDREVLSLPRFFVEHNTLSIMSVLWRSDSDLNIANAHGGAFLVSTAYFLVQSSVVGFHVLIVLFTKLKFNWSATTIGQFLACRELARSLLLAATSMIMKKRKQRKSANTPAMPASMSALPSSASEGYDFTEAAAEAAAAAAGAAAADRPSARSRLCAARTSRRATHSARRSIAAATAGADPRS